MPDCLDVVLNRPEAEARFQRASSAFSALKEYRDLLREIDERESSDPGSCRGLGPLVAERAVAFENHVRMLSADALANVNELRDAGSLQTILAQTAEAAEATDGDLADALHRIREDGGLKHVDSTILDEAEDLARGRAARVRRDGKTFRLEMLTFDGERNSETFSAAAEPGSSGRVSVADFFAGDRRVVGALRPIGIARDCHRASFLPIAETVAAKDIYASFVGGLATTRDAAYGHMRRVQEVGHSGFRGRDPVTALVVGLIAAGAILIGAGVYVIATGGDPVTGIFLIGLGVMFIGGGICVALGACSFAVHLLVRITA
jgi:hypothetical protein